MTENREDRLAMSERTAFLVSGLLSIIGGLILGLFALKVGQNEFDQETAYKIAGGATGAIIVGVGFLLYSIKASPPDTPGPPPLPRDRR